MSRVVNSTKDSSRCYVNDRFYPSFSSLFTSHTMSSTHWKIHSAWSKAGIGTNIVLELLPSSTEETGKQNKKMPMIAFDMGSTPVFDAAIRAKYVFLSHGHVDHTGGVFSHARAHSVSCGGEAPTYYAPAELVPQLEQCRDAMMALDATCLHSNGGRESLLKANFVAVKPGDEFLLKGVYSGSKTSFLVRAFQVDHCGHPALGYVIVSRTITGLKEEYKNLDKSALRDLAKSGRKLQSDPIEIVEVAYTGDTCARGLLPDLECTVASSDGLNIDKSDIYKQQLFQAEVILCELTYLDSTENENGKRRAAERGHLHICELNRIFNNDVSLDDTSVEDRLDSISTCISTKQSQHIIFYHLSGRSSSATRALDMITEGLPCHLRSRCHVAVASLVSNEEKNSLGKLVQPNGCISLMAYLIWRDRPK